MPLLRRQPPSSPPHTRYSAEWSLDQFPTPDTPARSRSITERDARAASLPAELRQYLEQRAAERQQQAEITAARRQQHGNDMQIIRDSAVTANASGQDHHQRARHKVDYPRTIGLGADDHLNPNGTYFTIPISETLTLPEDVRKNGREDLRTCWQALWQKPRGVKPVCELSAQQFPERTKRRRPRIRDLFKEERYYQISGSRLPETAEERRHDSEERMIYVSEKQPIALRKERFGRYMDYFKHVVPSFRKSIKAIAKQSPAIWEADKERYIRLGLEDSSRYKSLAKSIYAIHSLLTERKETSPFYLELMCAFRIDNHAKAAEYLLDETIYNLDEGQEVTLSGGGNMGAGLGIDVNKKNGHNSYRSKQFFEANATLDRNTEMKITKRGESFVISFKSSRGTSADMAVAPVSYNLIPDMGGDLTQNGSLHLDALKLHARAEATLSGRRVRQGTEMETFSIHKDQIAAFLTALKGNQVEDILGMAQNGIHTMKEKGVDYSAEAAAFLESRAAIVLGPVSNRGSVGLQARQELINYGHAERHDTAPVSAGAKEGTSEKTESGYRRILGDGGVTFQIKDVGDLTAGAVGTREQTAVHSKSLLSKEVDDRKTTTMGHSDVTEEQDYEQIVYSFNKDNLDTQLTALEKAVEEAEDMQRQNIRISGNASALKKLADALVRHNEPTEHILGQEFRDIDPALQCAAYMLAQKKEGKQATTLRNSRTGDAKTADLLEIYKDLNYDDVEVVVHNNPNTHKSQVVQMEFKKSKAFDTSFMIPFPALIGICHQGISFTDSIVAIPQDVPRGRDGRVANYAHFASLTDINDRSLYRFGIRVV